MLVDLPPWYVLPVLMQDQTGNLSRVVLRKRDLRIDDFEKKSRFGFGKQLEFVLARRLCE